ncbi:hypothetical protein FRC01_006553 [Tulasnella sp. 417]|nr:hypothetical protein FRC01_006553 [Tulasnella sp. 417]
MRYITKLSLLAASFATSAYGSLQIIPGATWTATNTGKHVQAHGGSITKVNGLYYLIGENKEGGSAFQSINCYSSPDLVQWTFVNSLLTLQGSGDLGPSRVVERPKVIFNSASNQWVMWMHIDSFNYGEAKVGVATSSSICGSYNYIRSFRPLGFESRDMGLFKDTDGTGYLLTEDRANGLRIDKLTSDYLDVASATYNFGKSADWESPAMVKVNGVYFMFGSHLTGWDTNDNIYSTATNLAGPWSSWKNGDSSQRFADVTVNGQTQRIAFLPTTDGNTPGSSTLHVNLNSGSSNTVQFVGVSGGWVSDIDRIMVPVS